LDEVAAELDELLLLEGFTLELMLHAAELALEDDELKLCKKSLISTDSASLNLSKSKQHLPSKYFDLGNLS
jgi:hypothetical protein